jgi:hypothetical protein
VGTTTIAAYATRAIVTTSESLGQLSQRARYRYTDEEVDEIEEAIAGKLRETIDAFRRGQGNKPGFQFRGSATKDKG